MIHGPRVVCWGDLLKGWALAFGVAPRSEAQRRASRQWVALQVELPGATGACEQGYSWDPLCCGVG